MELPSNTELQPEILTYVADPKQSLIRLDKFLMDRIEKISRNKIQNGIKEGLVMVNDKQVKANYKIRPHDVVKVTVFRPPEGELRIKPENIPLDVRYEDDTVMVVYKPPGLVVHPGVKNYSGTLVNALAHHFKETNLPVKDEFSDRPGIVHRIDKDTSGLMVIAKTETAMTHLAKQFFDHTVRREYVALVWGDVEEDKGTIIANIGRNPNNHVQFKVFAEEEMGKKAITHFEVLERLYYVTLIKCRLETGRTHQIRVHMKHLGHTLFNDWRYGGDQILKGTVFTKYKQFVQNCFKILPRQALHAQSLGFIHPSTGEELLFETDLPDDMQQCLDKWRAYLQSRKELL